MTRISQRGRAEKLRCAYSALTVFKRRCPARQVPQYLTKEADEISQSAYAQLDSEQFDCIDIDKIGGTPAFFQGDDTMQEGCWKLLLQLHCNFLPFVLRAGGSPTMFVFVSKDFEKGGILIQDS